MCEFGDTGNDTSCEKQFNLEEDESGLTFQEWTPDVDTSQFTTTCGDTDQLQ
jgi:hypothetical protein